MKKNYIFRSLIVLLCCLFSVVSAKAEVSTITASPEITTSADGLSFIYLTVTTGETTTYTINVKGKDLTQDITVSYDGYGYDGDFNSISLTQEKFNVSTTTIPMEDAMSENGYDLILSAKGVKGGDTFIVDLILSSGDANKQYQLYWSVADVTKVANIAEMRAQESTLPLYRISGEVGVSYSDAGIIFIQDETGGARIDREYADITEGYNRGDHFTNILCEIDWDNQLYLYPYEETLSAQKEVKPTIATLEELSANPNRYESCLVAIANVDFGTKAGGTIAATTTSTATQNGKTIQVGTFEGSDLVGSTIPTAADIVGVITYTNPLTITMRDSKDLLAPNAIDEVEVNNRVWVAGNILHIEAEAAVDVVVFDLLGKQVAAQTAVKRVELALPAGIYVVKVNNQATKVVIR